MVIHRRAEGRDTASPGIWTHRSRSNNARRPWVLTSQGDRGGLARAPYPRCRIRHQGTKRSPPAGSALPSRTVPNVLNDRSPTLLSTMTISLPLSFRTRPGILLRLLARSDPSSSLIIPSLSKNLAPSRVEDSLSAFLRTTSATLPSSSPTAGRGHQGDSPLMARSGPSRAATAGRTRCLSERDASTRLGMTTGSGRGLRGRRRSGMPRQARLDGVGAVSLNGHRGDAVTGSE